MKDISGVAFDSERYRAVKMQYALWSSGAARGVKQERGSLASGNGPFNPRTTCIHLAIALLNTGSCPRVHLEHRGAIHGLSGRVHCVFEIAFDNQQTSAGIQEYEFDIASG